MTLFEAPMLPVYDAASVKKGATLSNDGLYRYDLTRIWGEGPTVLWVMLNPSTADANVDDPTIRRCIGFTRAWGFGSLAVVNQFALRATNPDELIDAPEPRGPHNERFILDWLGDCEFAVAAWGAWKPSPRKVQAKHNYLPVASMARDAGKALYSLGTTSRGFPRHPLYIKGDTEREPWPRGARYEVGEGGTAQRSPALSHPAPSREQGTTDDADLRPDCAPASSRSTSED